MNSTFVNLSDYCILEYRSVPLGSPSPELLSSNFFLVDNRNTDALQIYNTDDYEAITHNSRSLSVVAVGGSRAIFNDVTLTPIYTQYDPNITETAISPTYSTNMVVDTVRIHFASGFNFSEVENVIFGVKQSLNDGVTQLQLANILLDAQTAQAIFTYSTRPLFLANTIYDRYVDLKIPSIPWLDADFLQFGSLSFEHQITKGIGFTRGAPITVFFSEATYGEYNAPNNVTYEQYQITSYNEGSISQVNKFDALGCHIEEAVDGDYIEFFATWNEAFPESLISILNESGPDQNWIFTHQLQVYEQIGSSIVPSGNLIVYQENNFDVPMTYRPILKEAGFAVAMSIDYTLRLINKSTGEQVVRTAALSVINPNKYGKRLAQIVLPDGPQSMKVYNKIVQKNFESGTLFAPKSTHISSYGTALPTGGSSSVVIKKVPELVMLKQAEIRLSQKNALHKMGNESDQVIYGQGRLTIPIDPTDNLIKFTVYQANPTNQTQQSRVDLNNASEFKMTFGTTTDFIFATVTDAKLTSPSRGELAFRVSKEKAVAILKTTDDQFHLSIVSKTDGTETMLYTGKWTSSVNYSDTITASEEAATALANENTIAELRKKVTSLTATNEALAETIKKNSATAIKTETSSTINLAAAYGANSSQVAKASGMSTNLV